MNRHLRNTLTKICALALGLSLGAGACGKRDDSERASAADNRAPISQEVKKEGGGEANTRPVQDPAKSPATEDEKNVMAPPKDPGRPTATMPTGKKGDMGHMRGGVGTGGGPGYYAQDGADKTTNTEQYAHNDVNKMILTDEDHLSTFSIDVDTASYAIARKKILSGQAVPTDAVRVEEFVNYFKYAYEAPGDDRPFAVNMEAAPSPFTKGRTLLRVGVQGKQLGKSQRKKAHLVFLVDVSGSMADPDKLPLAKQSLRTLVNNLNDGDTVALVTYAGSTRVVLEPTGMDQKAKIHEAIEDLGAGGSTAMASGLELAYSLAAKQIDDKSISRVIVLSDGDANVGASTHEEILKTIKGHVKEGVTLSTVGFGQGNYKDTMMEQLADKGNGNAYYIDSPNEAKKVFQEQLGGTLEVIASDVKIQVDFNADTVKAYRLVGYENRDIADKDFRDDKVDAGEIGAGHSVTAVYELELATATKAMKADVTPADLKLATVRIRAKKPRGAEAAESAYVLTADKVRASFADATPDFRFATAVVGFAEILRKSPYADGWKIDDVQSIAREASPKDNDERQEFLTLVAAYARRS